MHVADVARANELAIGAVAEASDGEWCAYNVCSGRPVTILEVAHDLARAYPDVPAPQVTGGFRPGDVRHVVASPEKARDELGFTARVTPEEGLVEFATAPLRS